uniref:MmpS family membrane protein n=1 Tax=Streptomyces sp. NBC_00003 TaxID=2903608 RepID=A0AAU2UXG4_9ACTN
MRKTMKKAFLATAASLLAVLVTGCAGETAKSEFEKLDAKEFEVVYEVTGSGVKTVMYEEGSKGEISSESVDDPKLPWKKNLTMNGIATAPNVSLILGEKGGQADCVITINGKEAKRATAKGEFGTASCVAVSPAGTTA